jgi:hypothetical protein
MGRPKKTSDYKVALEKLRAKHADKIEPLFRDMYNIAHGVREDGQPVSIDDRDRVNAAKLCISMLGVPRTATEKPDPAAKDTKGIDKPTLSKAHSQALDDILGETCIGTIRNDAS